MPKTSVDADAQAFLTAAAITDPTISSSINKLVVDLKSAGVWSKMKAIYPFVGGTASTHKFNLKDPRDLNAAFRLSFLGGWTHNANGAQPNGTNGYANTFFNPSTNLVFDNLSFGLYSRTQDVSGTKIYGVRDTTLFRDMYHNVSTKFFSTDGNAATFSYTLTPTTGLINFSRTSNISGKVYSNGVLIATKSTSVVSLMPNANFFLGARSDNGSPIWYNNYQVALHYISTGLTDTDAANLYNAIQTFQTSLGRSIGTQTVSDADAQAFVTNAAIVDQVEANAVNKLVIDMKAAGVWSKMKAIYPFVGGSASSHKFNLKDPRDLDAAFRLVFNGGWTHSSNGAQPNGTNGYADTFYIPSIQASQNSHHLSYYSRTEQDANSVDIGCSIWPNGYDFLQIKTSGISYYGINILAAFDTYTNSSSIGYFIANRTASNDQDLFKSGTKVKNGTAQSHSVLCNISVAISALKNANGTYTNYSSKQVAFSSIGDGLSDTEAANFYTAVQNFQTTLNRQV
jgi:hypothetical protein